MVNSNDFNRFRSYHAWLSPDCFSRGFAIAASVLFSLLMLLSFHVIVTNSSEVIEGQTIYGTYKQNVFLPFSVKDGLAFLVLVPLVFIFFSLIVQWMNSSKSIDNHVEWTWRKSVLGFALLIVAWLPYLLSWFPGGVFADTSVVISQALGGMPLSNRHTVLYVLIWRACIAISGALGHGLFFSTVLMGALQVVAMASAALFAVRWLITHHVGRGFCIGAFAFFALFPLVPIFAISLWKDTLFSVALFFLSMFFIDAVLISLKFRGSQDNEDANDGDGTILRRPQIDYSLSFGLVFSSLATAFLRNNGIYVVALALVSLGLLNRHQIRAVSTNLLLPLACAVALSAVIQGPLFGLFGFNTSNAVESVGIPLQQVARTLTLDGSMSEEARAYFEQLLPEEIWREAYRPFIVDTIKWNEYFDASVLNENLPHFLEYYFETGLRNPVIYIEGFLLANSGFWNPFIGWTENVGHISLSMWGIELSQFDLIQQWVGISLRDLLAPSAYVSAAVFVWIVLFAFSTLLIGKRGWLAISLTPSLALWATLMIATPIAYSLRYAFALVLITPIALGLLFVAKKTDIKDQSQTLSVGLRNCPSTSSGFRDAGK